MCARKLNFARTLLSRLEVDVTWSKWKFMYIYMCVRIPINLNIFLFELLYVLFLYWEYI